MLALAACEKAGEQMAPTVEAELVFDPQYVSEAPTTPVTSVPQLRSAPGTKVAGQATVCKDISSPATQQYTFSVSATNRQQGDMLATSVTLSPGQCAIVYNRVVQPRSPVTSVMITEVIPAGASYRLDRVNADDDASGPRTVAGPSVTLLVNGFHGAFANFFNVTPPPPPSAFRFIARVAFTCTNGSIAGSVATNQTTTELPPGSVTQTLCPITGTTEIGTAAAKQAYQDFLVAFAAAEATACGTTLTGTLAGQTLAPGVYCFDNAATLTGTLTLSGPSTGVFLFKIGGALTGTNFNVVLDGGASACNVTWQVRQASTMNTSNFKGNILAGAGVTFTGGTYKGNASSKEDVAVTGTAVTACDAP